MKGSSGSSRVGFTILHPTIHSVSRLDATWQEESRGCMRSMRYIAIVSMKMEPWSLDSELIAVPSFIATIVKKSRSCVKLNSSAKKHSTEGIAFISNFNFFSHVCFFRA